MTSRLLSHVQCEISRSQTPSACLARPGVRDSKIKSITTSVESGDDNHDDVNFTHTYGNGNILTLDIILSNDMLSLMIVHYNKYNDYALNMRQIII